MKSLLTCLLLLCFTTAGITQTSHLTDAELNELSSNINSDYMITTKTKRIKGDPYFNEKWVRGIVHINEKAQTRELNLRFNMAENILEFSRDEQIFIMDSGKIAGFTLRDISGPITFRNGYNVDNRDIGSDTFLRVIHDGSISLLAYHTSDLKEGMATYGSATKEEEYVDKTEFYIGRQEGELKEIKLKKKDLFQLFEKEKRSEMEAYVKGKNLRYDNESDLADILSHYEMLMSDS